MIDPVAEYDHDEGVAVIGGYVYRGAALADDMDGIYVFGDFGGRLFYFDGTTIRELDLFGQDGLGGALLGMGEGIDGELYLLVNDTGAAFGTSGRLLRIDAVEPLEGAIADWTGLMAEFYALQGLDDPADSAWIDIAVANWTAAAESGDQDALTEAQKFVSGMISAINWGRNRWGDPLLTDAQADALIAAAEAILDALPEVLESGLRTMESGGVERSYYLKLPADYYGTLGEKPLIVGFHGSFGSHTNWIGPGPSYTFVDVVGDGAIMVFPNALPLGTGGVNWNGPAYDYDYFADLVAELKAIGLDYDINQLLVIGHSSGAGMTAEIGCRYGDIVRAIAISSGSLVSNQCIGSVAVIQTQGDADTAVPPTIGEVSHHFWVLYNGWDIDMSTAGVAPQCIDHSLLPLGSSAYPVQWCSHTGGHAWPDFASQAYWDFFSGVPIATPSTDEPAGGGNDRVLADADTTISFTLNYPAEMSSVVAGAITLYPPTYCRGLFAAPSVFLNASWFPGDVTPGSTVVYDNVPITFFVFGPGFVPGDYQLQISVYNQGGSQPIPTPGIDHTVLVPLTIADTTTPIIVPTAQDVLVVEPFIGACPSAVGSDPRINSRSGTPNLSTGYR
jgi:predicted esterase